MSAVGLTASTGQKLAASSFATHRFRLRLVTHAAFFFLILLPFRRLLRGRFARNPRKQHNKTVSLVPQPPPQAAGY